MSKQRVALSVLLVIAVLAPGVILAQPAAPQAAPAPEAQTGAMLFVENAGQWPDAARFQVWGSPAGVGTTWLADGAIWITVVGEGDAPGSGRRADKETLVPSSSPPITPSPAVAIKFTFAGANPNAHIEPFDPLTTTVSYFLGNDPAQWRPDVPVYDGVRYANLYPGVDLVLNSAGRAGGIAPLPAAYTAAVDLRRAARGEKRAQNLTECIGGYV